MREKNFLVFATIFYDTNLFDLCAIIITVFHVLPILVLQK